ncbi:S-adenosylmethionine synthetase [Wolbachia endosymbiont of Culex quinquefasciatus JHB]|uniref:S-adenosylmethionine synthase n=1 Tax=Pararge aegeria aegeria TaxID=348720 RepID=A0A8S4QL26_9NEOP|nr:MULTISPECIES: methionine adenosyltransferase [unclassified Wolbachia]EEB56516.1 S-adenosylmethionine synthetase [Wolbachia endosymbiont of Culex quinquefasciatus JHB]CAH2210748.1 jg17529 [Pararge aegeria aegeria]CAQ55250.1 S-adenosylmethionine synthetase [Wolbachia endosymbiont of Culex quinquefasciatus Pel]CQD05871.1 S-adenosylmethionine synthetase [Wolbachia endosymbiont wPip_Mol of Culex molestus]
MVLHKNSVTSESVAAGHPDKVADQISDAILDEYLFNDSSSRTAIETLVTKDNVIIAGEVFGPNIENSKIESIVRNTIKDIGYEHDGFHWETVKVNILLHEQSNDIAIGVDQGAGDQGIMYGYATIETESLMPAPIFYAHSILRNIMSMVKEVKLGPDAKSQITLAYENNLPVRAESIVVSIQHLEDLSQSKVKEIIYPYIASSLPKGWMCPKENLLVNPTGRFVIGGPVGDCGLTGRKIMVDTYGGYIPHGGGAFSGKDATKVDRSAAYMARYLAKNIVFAGLAERCLVQLSYAIGVSKPTSFYIDTFGTNTIDEERIKGFIEGNIDLSTKGIIRHLSLNRPIYKRTACYGHFGKKLESDGGFSWEGVDLSTDFCKEFNIEEEKREFL